LATLGDDGASIVARQLTVDLKPDLPSEHDIQVMYVQNACMYMCAQTRAGVCMHVCTYVYACVCFHDEMHILRPSNELPP
jgi:hypothetical protein